AVVPREEERPRVVVWEVATGKETHRFEAPPRTCAADFTADGKLLLTGTANGLHEKEPDNTVRFWSLAAGKEVRRLRIGADLPDQRGSSGTTVRAMVQSPDRKLLAVLADRVYINYGPPGRPGPEPQPYLHGVVRLFELATGKELLRAETDRG